VVLMVLNHCAVLWSEKGFFQNAAAQKDTSPRKTVADGMGNI
jgi:hypothetical protein